MACYALNNHFLKTHKKNSQNVAHSRVYRNRYARVQQAQKALYILFEISTSMLKGNFIMNCQFVVLKYFVERKEKLRCVSKDYVSTHNLKPISRSNHVRYLIFAHKEKHKMAEF